MRKPRRLVVVVLGLISLAAVVSLFPWPSLAQRYRFWRSFEFLRRNEFGRLEYRHRLTGMVLVKVTKIVDWSGSATRNRMAPKAEVVESFLIAKYEVTEQQWLRVMEDLPDRHYARDPGRPSEFPVTAVPWNDCVRFVERCGLTLPTKEQWEFVCQSDPPLDEKDVLDRAWCFENSEWIPGRPFSRAPHPVGRKRANLHGCYDVLGNVSEWCSDKDLRGGDVYDESRDLLNCEVLNRQSDRLGGTENSGLRPVFVIQSR